MELQLASAAVGAVLGAVGGFGVRLTVAVLRDRTKRRRLRVGLYEEITTMSEDIDAAAEDLRVVSPDSDAVPVPADIFVTATYEANADRIGLLTRSETKEVVRFYSSCVRLRRLIRSMDDDPTPGEVHRLRRSMVSVHGRLRDVLIALETQLDIPPADRHSETLPELSLPESGDAPVTANTADTPTRESPSVATDPSDAPTTDDESNATDS